MKLVIKDEKYQVTIFEKVYEFKKPLIDHFLVFQAVVEDPESKINNKVDAMVKLCVDCGIPLEVVKSVPMSSLNELVECLLEGKKK